MSDGEEAEFENDGANATKMEEKPVTPDNAPGDADNGAMAWKTAIANANSQSSKAKLASKPTTLDSPPPIQIPSRKANSKTSSEDVAMASRLDFFAKRARDMSDASLLEDFGEGLPYLSGACRGFAYDFTEECRWQVSKIYIGDVM